MYEVYFVLKFKIFYMKSIAYMFVHGFRVKNVDYQGYYTLYLQKKICIICYGQILIASIERPDTPQMIG